MIEWINKFGNIMRYIVPFLILAVAIRFSHQRNKVTKKCVIISICCFVLFMVAMGISAFHLLFTIE